MSGHEDDLAYGEYNERGFGDESSRSGQRGSLGDTFKKLRSKYSGGSQYGQQAYPQQQGQQQFGPGQQYAQGQPGQVPQQYGQSQLQQSQGQPYGQPGIPVCLGMLVVAESVNSPWQGQNAPPGSQGPQLGPGSAQGYYNQQQKPDLVSSLFGKLHSTIGEIGGELASKLGGHYDVQDYGYTSATQGGYGQQAGYNGYGAQAARANRFESFAGQKNGNDVKWHVDGCSYMWAVSRALEGARESIWILDCE